MQYSNIKNYCCAIGLRFILDGEATRLYCGFFHEHEFKDDIIINKNVLSAS